MVQRLSVEIQKEPGEWLPIGTVNLGDPDGTVSDNHQNGRDIYQFGVDPIENQGYIKKSELGADVEDSGFRAVTSTGFILVAALNDTESYELTVKTDKSPKPRTLRLTYQQD